jgi:hypothetical protein
MTIMDMLTPARMTAIPATIMTMPLAGLAMGMGMGMGMGMNMFMPAAPVMPTTMSMSTVMTRLISMNMSMVTPALAMPTPICMGTSMPMTRLISMSMSMFMPTARPTAIPVFTDTNMPMAMLIATTTTMWLQTDPVAAMRIFMEMMVSMPLRWSTSKRAFWPKTTHSPQRTGLGLPAGRSSR